MVFLTMKFQDKERAEEFDHPMPCSKCRKTFDAWGYTLSQRTRGPWRGLCDPCKETANLKGWAGKEEA